MEVLITDTIRDLVSEVNKLGITKESIVTLLRTDGQYTLLYYNK